MHISKLDLYNNSLYFLFTDISISYIIIHDGAIRENTIGADINSESYLRTIESIIIEEKLDQITFDIVDCAINNKLYTLVPDSYFDEDNAEDFLNFNTPYSQELGIRFNRIAKLSLAIPFYYTEEIEELLERFFPSIRIMHTSAKFLSNLSSKSQPDGLYVYRYSNIFEIAVIKNNELSFFNSYQYSNANEIPVLINAMKIKLGLGRNEELNIINTTENFLEEKYYTTLDLV